MDNIKNYVLLGAVVLAVAFGVMAFKNPSAVSVPSEPYGASSGTTHSFREFFNSGMTMGGTVSTTTTATTYTTETKDFLKVPTVISWLPNVDTTVSLSSTSTLAYVPNVGDTATIYIRNASTTAAASITFAAVDANLDLQKNEDTADLAVVGLDWAKLTLIHTSQYLVTVFFEDLTEAD